MASQKHYLAIALLIPLLAGCGDRETPTSTVDDQTVDAQIVPGAQSALYNPEAVIPPMCYTRTESTHNPCFTCHQDYKPGIGHSNYRDDGFLQGDYNFSDIGAVNHWTNLFVDRSAEVTAISDEVILAYINEDNYSGFSERLLAEGFLGWLPDLDGLAAGAAAFDEQGFANDGSGWVAFNYKPFPSTFWPTNGSTDDVMIRLPQPFRQDAAGNDQQDIYIANLAIAEAAIKNFETITLPQVDEGVIGVDLNGDSVLGPITELTRPASYLGGAAEFPVVTFLYPEGTEFLHTVRYVGVNDSGEIYNAPRMKEVRYMRKHRFYDKTMLGNFYAEEEKHKEEGMLPYYRDMGDNGIDNGFGWQVLGFIEDANGRLRKQSYEENLFCMGCHTVIGATIDQTFAFPRKVTGAAGWGYINLKDMTDAPALGENDGEILNYLRIAGGGDEFRQNMEMREKWFAADGSVDEAKVMAADVYTLITPSRERALELNKAYRVIVQEQSFMFGRDATVKPATNVFQVIDTTMPPLDADKQTTTDIRLDW